MAQKWIYWFEDLSSDHNDLVGKKCANLGEMTRLGMRVPPGFAISVEGYERFMLESGAGEEIRRYVRDNKNLLGSVDKQIEASRKIRYFIHSKGMPAEMLDELCYHYDLLCERVAQPELSVAVRSSGAVSMPGQMETFLNVEVWRASKVIQVWERLYSEPLRSVWKKIWRWKKHPLGWRCSKWSMPSVPEWCSLFSRPPEIRPK
jgi:pyruvate,water dikinase